MDNVDVANIVYRLSSSEDSARKDAAFKLQSIIGDPSFADNFISQGGLYKLQSLCKGASGNTLAYSLTSFSRLLELDLGWDHIDRDLVERLTQLIVGQPLVNILRGAMSILAAIVSHPQPQHRSSSPNQEPPTFGYSALKPIIATHPEFLSMLVRRLTSADHALCYNALQLINALIRDVLPGSSNSASNSKAHHTVNAATQPDAEWKKLVKQLQDLGVVKNVYILMTGRGVQDLAQPLLEFQALTRSMLRNWHDEQIDFGRKDHRRALKAIHAVAAKGDDPLLPPQSSHENHHGSPGHTPQIGALPHEDGAPKELGTITGHTAGRRDPEKWRKLGFSSESPAWDFEDVGYLGMMDFQYFVRRSEDGFRKLLLEQQAKPAARRYPIARASLAVTLILYDHFEVDRPDNESERAALESRSNFDHVFKPMLLQWTRLHAAALQAFFRLWDATGAETLTASADSEPAHDDDLPKIEELIRILVEHVVGLAPRTKPLDDVEKEIADYSLQALRDLQMELLELTVDDVWGQHLRGIKEELQGEAMQFVREQRIRCLLHGAWFSNVAPAARGKPTPSSSAPAAVQPHRYVRLSHNRRFLHYGDFDARSPEHPPLDSLETKIDLELVSGIDSNIADHLHARPRTADTAGDPETNGADAPAPAPADGHAGSLHDSDGGLHDAHAVESDSEPDDGAGQHAARPRGLSGHSARRARSSRLPSIPSAKRATSIVLHGPPHAASHVAAFPAAQPSGPHKRNQSSMGGDLMQHIQGQGQGQGQSQGQNQNQTQSQNQNQNQNQNQTQTSPQSKPQSDPVPLLTLHPSLPSTAAEFLDGLLMLTEKTASPVSAETVRLVRFVSRFGLKVRLLNLRFEDSLSGFGRNGADEPDEDEDEMAGAMGVHAQDARAGAGLGVSVERVSAGGAGLKRDVVLPGREGVDDEFFYEIGNEEWS